MYLTILPHALFYFYPSDQLNPFYSVRGTNVGGDQPSGVGERLPTIAEFGSHLASAEILAAVTLRVVRIHHEPDCDRDPLQSRPINGEAASWMLHQMEDIL